MITRQQIRQFLAVVDTGSFTLAAQKVGVAQPSLSSGIRQLEEQVGTVLFERRRPSVRLTAAANRLLPIARRIDREFKRAEIEVAQPVQSGQEFVLGVIPTIPATTLSKVAAKFGASIVLREKPMRELQAELRKGAVDAVLGLVATAPEDGLHINVLWSEPYALIVSASHHLAGRKTIAAQEVADEVMIARRSCELLAETSKFFTDCGVRPRFSFKSVNDEKAIALVRAGLGITVAPISMAGEGLEAIELLDFGASRSVGLFARADDHTHASRYREKVQAIREILGQP